MRDQKPHEEAMVVAAYRVAHKWTVVIEFMHTAAQEVVVFCPERSSDVARMT